MENEQKITQKEMSWIVPYRIIASLLSIIAINLSLIQGVTNPEWDTGKGNVFNYFNGFAFFIIQSNIMVFCWWLAAIFKRKSPESLEKIEGKLRGAILLYISITFFIFAVVLSWSYSPTQPIAKFTNISLHYILPPMFIIDWIMTEKKEYSWSYIKMWLIYPSIYLIYAIIYFELTDIVLYFFIDYKTLGIGTFIGIILGVVFTFIVFSSLI